MNAFSYVTLASACIRAGAFSAVCGLFHDVTSISDYIASADKMIVERWIGKDLKGSGRGVIEGLTQNLPGTEEDHKYLSQAIRCTSHPVEIRTQHLQETSLECCC
jgi:hypothetical protein